MIATGATSGVSVVGVEVLCGPFRVNPGGIPAQPAQVDGAKSGCSRGVASSSPLGLPGADRRQNVGDDMLGSAWRGVNGPQHQAGRERRGTHFGPPPLPQGTRTALRRCSPSKSPSNALGDELLEVPGAMGEVYCHAHTPTLIDRGQNRHVEGTEHVRT